MSDPGNIPPEGDVTQAERNVPEPSPQRIRESLQEILLSTTFRGSNQSQHLLQYLVDQAIEGHPEMLKERMIGVNVFGRSSTYNTGDDSIVRVRAADLRKRLAQYYIGEGAKCSLRIEVQPGSYQPVFRQYPEPLENTSGAESDRKVTTEADFIGARSSTAGVTSEDSVVSVPGEGPKDSRRHRGMAATTLVLGLLVVALAGICVALWFKVQSMERVTRPWKNEPSLAAFWSGFFDSPSGTDIVVSDSAFSMVQRIYGQHFSLNEYIKKSYISQINPTDPGLAANLNRIANWDLGSGGEFKLTRRMLALDPLNQRVHVYGARDYMSDLVRQDNLILVGSHAANPWDELFEDRMNFVMDSQGLLINKNPKPGEQKTYSIDGRCVVAYLPSQHLRKVLLIEGGGPEATQAAGDLLLSEEQLSNFKNLLHVATLPYFEVLLKVSAVRGTPISFTIEAYRTYPDQR